MNIEQLKAMSNAEINKLCATKVMGLNYRGYLEEMPEHPYVSLDPNGKLILFNSEGYKNWNPSEDMNDLKLIEDRLDDLQFLEYTVVMTEMVGHDTNIDFGCVGKLLKLSAKDRCIAMILAVALAPSID